MRCRRKKAGGQTPCGSCSGWAGESRVSSRPTRGLLPRGLRGGGAMIYCAETGRTLGTARASGSGTVLRSTSYGADPCPGFVRRTGRTVGRDGRRPADRRRFEMIHWAGTTRPTRGATLVLNPAALGRIYNQSARFPDACGHARGGALRRGASLQTSTRREESSTRVRLFPPWATGGDQPDLGVDGYRLALETGPGWAARLDAG